MSTNPNIPVPKPQPDALPAQLETTDSLNELRMSTMHITDLNHYLVEHDIDFKKWITDPGSMQADLASAAGQEGFAGHEALLASLQADGQIDKKKVRLLVAMLEKRQGIGLGAASNTEKLNQRTNLNIGGKLIRGMEKMSSEHLILGLAGIASALYVLSLQSDNKIIQGGKWAAILGTIWVSAGTYAEKSDFGTDLGLSATADLIAGVPPNAEKNDFSDAIYRMDVANELSENSIARLFPLPTDQLIAAYLETDTDPFASSIGSDKVIDINQYPLLKRQFPRVGKDTKKQIGANLYKTLNKLFGPRGYTNKKGTYFEGRDLLNAYEESEAPFGQFLIGVEQETEQSWAARTTTMVASAGAAVFSAPRHVGEAIVDPVIGVIGSGIDAVENAFSDDEEVVPAQAPATTQTPATTQAPAAAPVLRQSTEISNLLPQLFTADAYAKRHDLAVSLKSIVASGEVTDVLAADGWTQAANASTYRQARFTFKFNEEKYQLIFNKDADTVVFRQESNGAQINGDIPLDTLSGQSLAHAITAKLAQVSIAHQSAPPPAPAAGPTSHETVQSHQMDIAFYEKDGEKIQINNLVFIAGQEVLIVEEGGVSVRQNATDAPNASLKKGEKTTITGVAVGLFDKGANRVWGAVEGGYIPLTYANGKQLNAIPVTPAIPAASAPAEPVPAQALSTPAPAASAPAEPEPAPAGPLNLKQKPAPAEEKKLARGARAPIEITRESLSHPIKTQLRVLADQLKVDPTAAVDILIPSGTAHTLGKEIKDYLRDQGIHPDRIDLRDRKQTDSITGQIDIEIKD